MRAYQYLLIDKEETCFHQYKLTELHYSSLEICEKDYPSASRFRVVGVFEKSKESGELAGRLTLHERK